MTVARRILINFAIGAAFVIAVVTAVTYALVYRALKQRDLQQLTTYVTERTQREEARFQQIQANLTLVRGQFLKRLENPYPGDVAARWEEQFRFYPDGAWRSREKFADGRKYAQLWCHKNWTLTRDAQRKIVVSQDLCEELLPGWVDSFPSVYFNFPGPANIGFDARIPSWVWDMPADYDTEKMEWLQLALPKTPPAPDIFLWTGVQQDVDLQTENPLINAPMVSVFLPIYKDGAFIGSVGHDMFMTGMLDEAMRSDIAGATHLIFRSDGRLVAHPTLRKPILMSKGMLKAWECGDAAVESLYRTCTARSERQFSGFDPESESYFSAARLAGPDWFFVIIMSRDRLQAQASASAQWVLWSGLISLGLVLVFIATILRRQVTRPLAELSRAAKTITAGAAEMPLAPHRADELGELAGSFREMGARVRAREAELRQLNLELEKRVAERTAELARFGTILDLTPDFVGICDMDQHVVYVNRTGRQMANLPLDGGLNGMKVADFHPRWAYDVIDQQALPTALREGIWTGEAALRDHTGCEIPVSAAVIVLRGPDGAPEYGATIMRDLTERQRTQEKLERALERERELVQLKSNFVSLVSHEFRTPLGIIGSSAQILDRYLTRLGDEERAEHLDNISVSVKRMAAMMEDMLVLSRVDSGRMEFRPAPIALGDFCRRLLDELHSAHGGDTALEVAADAEVTANADENLLRHILNNLLTNAQKYSRPGAPVRLTLAREGRDAVFAVRDEGIGIPEADQARLFNAFHRGANVGHVNGTGLGLVIVRRCCELHGGTVSVVSREGAGTTFTVRLPAFAE